MNSDEAADATGIRGRSVGGGVNTALEAADGSLHCLLFARPSGAAEREAVGRACKRGGRRRGAGA